MPAALGAALRRLPVFVREQALPPGAQQELLVPRHLHTEPGLRVSPHRALSGGCTLPVVLWAKERGFLDLLEKGAFWPTLE